MHAAVANQTHPAPPQATDCVLAGEALTLLRQMTASPSPMTTTPQLTTDRRDDLATAVRALIERQLRGAKVAYCWPERHRVRIRTATGLTGDVEVAVELTAAVAQE